MRSIRTRRRGFALIMVLVTLALILAIWLLAQDHLGAALRQETLHASRAERDQGRLLALARGVRLLETGEPSTNPYSCQVSLSTPRGNVIYKVTYETSQIDYSTTSPTTWTVTATVRPDIEVLPLMPDSFE